MSLLFLFIVIGLIIVIIVISLLLNRLPPTLTFLKPIAIMLIIPIIIVYVLDGLLGGGFQDPFLRIWVSVMPDSKMNKTIKEFSCGSGYIWKVGEKTVLKEGNLLEIGTVTHLNTERYLNLVSPKNISMRIGEEFRPYTYFSTGEGFLQALVFDSTALTNGAKIESGPGFVKIWTAYTMQSSDISIEDFKVVSQCLYQHKPEIESTLNNLPAKEGRDQYLGISYYSSSVGDSYRQMQNIAWTMLIDSSVERSSESDPVSGIIYKCNDDKIVYTVANNLAIYSKLRRKNVMEDYISGGIIDISGNVYKLSKLDNNNPDYTRADLQQQVAVPKNCVDSNGQSIKSALHSIPSRIIILDHQ